MAKQKAGKAAAYVPFKTLLTATAALKTNGVPKKLDRSAFPSFSGSMKSWIISAFEFLGFIDEHGDVQPLLQRWIDAGDGRKGIMREIVTAQYIDVVALAKEKGTPDQMRKEIEKLGVSGTTSQKAIRFYIAACEYAGIDVPPTWKKARVSVGNGKKSKTRSDAVKPKNAPPPPPQPTESIALEGDAGTVSLTIDANLMALSSDDRDWLFSLIDDFQSYKVEHPDDADDDEPPDDDEGDA